MLLLERGHYRPHRFDKTRPLGTLCAKAAFAPQDPRADSALRRIVRGLDAFHAHKGPQGVVGFEHLPTDAFRLGHTTGLARFEPPCDRAPDGTHRDPELGVREMALADPMPRMKHLPGLLPQAFSNFLRPSPTLDHGFKVPQQMRPADLAPAGRIPGIGAPAVGHQNATELFPQQL